MVVICEFYKKINIEPKTVTEKCIPGYEYIKNLPSCKGSFGDVQLYQNHRTRATVAVKQISYMKNGKNYFDEFADEINFMMDIKHPNIANYHDYFIIDQQHELYIVKEYAKRGSLRLMLTDRLVKWEYFNQSALIQIIRDIICGAKYLNSLNVVLWDLNPDNIMVGDDGYMKISDFGKLHHVKSRSSADISALSYMAHELYDGLRPDEKSVVWSIGVIFYEMCTLQHPFQPFATIDDLLPKVRSGQISLFNFHANEYNYDMQELLGWMLKANRLNRRTLSNLLEHTLLRIKSPVYLFVEM